MARVDRLRDNRVRTLIRQIVPSGGAVLEVSCGRAGLLGQLGGDGYAVRGTNFTAYNHSEKSVEIDNGVDVMVSLPYGTQIGAKVTIPHAGVSRVVKVTELRRLLGKRRVVIN